MKGLIRKILKEIEEEKELSKFQKKILHYISENGILETIKMVGDYENFIRVLPDYFNKNSHKVDLINQIVQDKEPDGLIVFYEEIGRDISLGEVEWYGNDDGHTFEEYIVSVGDGAVQIFVYEYDDEGFMYDEYADRYDVSLGKLPDIELNQVFEVLVNNYLL